MSHEEICPCNLQCNFCRKKYSRLQLTCQTYATCLATCNEIIFYPHRVFKNVRGILIMSYCDWFLLKKIARHVAVGVSHAATCRVALWKVEAASSFSATGNPIFRSRLVANMGCHMRKSSLQLTMERHLRCNNWKENCLVWHGVKQSVSRVETCGEICVVTNYVHEYMYILRLLTSDDFFLTYVYVVCSIRVNERVYVFWALRTYT